MTTEHPKHPRYKAGTYVNGLRRSISAGSNFVQIGDPAYDTINQIEGMVWAFSATLITLRLEGNDYAHVRPCDIRYGTIPQRDAIGNLVAAFFPDDPATAAKVEAVVRKVATA